MSARRALTIALSLATSLLGACKSAGDAARPVALESASSAASAARARDAGRSTRAVEVSAAIAEDGLPSSPPPIGEAPRFRMPRIERTTLSNGARVAFVEHRALPVLHVRVLLRGAGSLFDPVDRPGLASFVAQLSREGVAGMDSRAIAEAFDGAGARLSTDVDDDAATLTLDVLPERAEATLTLLGRVLREPTFDPRELEKLRRRELDRLAQEMADPAWLSSKPFYREVYGRGHPYGRFDTTREALRSITRDEVVSFHRARVTGGSLVVVGVGALRAEEFASLARRAFDGLPAGSTARPTMPALAAREARQVFIVDRPASAQAFVRVGRVGVRRDDARWPALAVANQILGASPSSRLFVDLRERRSLTYGVYTRVRAAIDEGVVSASGSTRLERTGDFVRALIEHMDGMAREPVPEAELERARRVVQNRLPTSVATASDIAARVSELELYALGDRYFDEYSARVGAVSADDVRAAARDCFETARSVIVVVGPARRLRPMLLEFGSVTVLRPGE